MAKKKKNKKVKKQQSFEPKIMSVSMLFIVVGALVTGLIALPTLVLLGVGCIPTFVAFITDKSARKSRTISVGVLNLAASSPYLFRLWEHGHTLEYALETIARPDVIVVMYAGAAVGYCIDWMLGGAISKVLYIKSQARLNDIEKKQADLLSKWDGIM